MERSRVLIIGGGMFGQAMSSLCAHNGIGTQMVDQGERADRPYEMVVLATPVGSLRVALSDNRVAFSDGTIVICCSKGIEVATGELPHRIFKELLIPGRYHALAGPSFAREVIAKVPTVVDIAGEDGADSAEIRSVLETPYFKIEAHDRVLEVELAGAMKNVYAIASGYIRAVGGGENTHAHAQVVALREYQALAEALEARREVARPSVAGDLFLTSGNNTSRNYRYGMARGTDQDLTDETVEGKHTVHPLLALAARVGVELPLARAVAAIITDGSGARDTVFNALGF